MRLKDLFTVPEGQKVTEKHFYRVLISSICSILLCMSCLAGTTWAWFTVSIENSGNEIQIVDLKESVVQDGQEISKGDIGYQLAEGSFRVSAVVERNGTNVLKENEQLYVVMTVSFDSGESAVYYHPDSIVTDLNLSKPATVKFTVQWTQPSGVLIADNSVLAIDDESDDSNGEQTAEPTGGEGTEPTGGESTEPTGGEGTEPTGGESTEPTGGESSEPTGGESTEPTGGENTESTGQGGSATV